MKKIFIIGLLLASIPKTILAHCPLCTVAAGGLAVLAASLGVSSVVVGILIGAFAIALGLWISKTIKKKYFKYQDKIFTILIFLGTVIPVMPFIEDYAPLYLPFFGQYGTTYTINLYIFGVIIGTSTMISVPFISRTITKIRNQQVPFQGIIIAIMLLLIISIVAQIFL